MLQRKRAGHIEHMCVCRSVDRRDTADPSLALLHRTQRVKRVMSKLIPFSGMADENWEIFVIEDPGTCGTPPHPRASF